MIWGYEQLNGNRYIIRPEGTLGTCGWIDGKPWSAQFVTGLRKAQRVVTELNKDQK